MSNRDKDTPPQPADNSPFTDDEVRDLLASRDERFSEKALDVEEEEQEERQVRPPKDPNVVWLNYPSVPEQMQRFPHTVRPGPRVDAVFNLSDKEELATFNRIQAEASNHVDGFTSVIHDLDKQFHQGQFFALVTYSKLFYQKM
jgi:hypothetical protein